MQRNWKVDISRCCASIPATIHKWLKKKKTFTRVGGCACWQGHEHTHACHARTHKHTHRKAQTHTTLVQAYFKGWAGEAAGRAAREDCGKRRRRKRMGSRKATPREKASSRRSWCGSHGSRTQQVVVIVTVKNQFEDWPPGRRPISSQVLLEDVKLLVRIWCDSIEKRKENQHSTDRFDSWSICFGFSRLILCRFSFFVVFCFSAAHWFAFVCVQVRLQ